MRHQKIRFRNNGIEVFIPCKYPVFKAKGIHKFEGEQRGLLTMVKSLQFLL
jgi:hypothetical protein